MKDLVPLHTTQVANFSSVLYADDTICMTDNISSMQNLLKTIEKVGSWYGLYLNKKKCLVMINNSKKSLYYNDIQQVKTVEEAVYLGCVLNQNMDMTAEVNKRISKCSATHEITPILAKGQQHSSL